MDEDPEQPDPRRKLSLTRMIPGSARLGDNGGEGDDSVRRTQTVGRRILSVTGKVVKSPDQVKDDFDVHRTRRRRNLPGDANSLLILAKLERKGPCKVSVKRKIAGLFTSYVQYSGEIRGCFGCFYSKDHKHDPDEERLGGLLAITSFRGCVVEVTRSSSKGDILRIRNHGKEIGLAFDTPEAMEFWFKQITDIAAGVPVRISDFRVVSPIGNGAGGKVFLVKHKATSEVLAMKVVDKETEVYKDRFYLQHAVDERILLENVVGNPFCVQLRYATQTRKRLYYMMDFCEGGDLFGYMWGQGRSVGETRGKIVAAQILLALEHIHAAGFVYRDLKPENILIDHKGFVHLADFGLCKKMRGVVRDERTSTICGTFSYLAPEMLAGNYGSSVDIWTFGVFLYQLISGKTPCDARSVEDARRFFRRGCPTEMDSDIMSAEAIALLKALLTMDTRKRLGCSPEGISELKEHPFFSGMPWEQLMARESIENTLDVKYINRMVYEDEAETQMVRNFDMSELKEVVYEDDDSGLVDNDWSIFPLLHWQDEGGDLDPHYLMGFDYTPVPQPPD